MDVLWRNGENESVLVKLLQYLLVRQIAICSSSVAIILI